MSVFDCNADSIKVFIESENYYFYDSLGNQNGFIQMFTDGRDEPFSSVYLKSFDLNTNTVKSASLEDYFGFETQFVFEDNEIENHNTYYSDTVKLSKFHSYFYSLPDSNITEDIFLNNDNLIDSTIFRCSFPSKGRGETLSIVKTIIKYDINNVITSKIMEFYSETLKVNPHLIREVSYQSNGLTEWIKTINENDETIELMKFQYFSKND